MEPGAPSFYWSPWFHPLLCPASTPRRGQGAAVGCGLRASSCWKAWETPLPHSPRDCALEGAGWWSRGNLSSRNLNVPRIHAPILLIWWLGKQVLSRASESVHVSSIKHGLQGIPVGSRWASPEDLSEVIRELMAYVCTRCIPGTVPLLWRWAT